jgi:hypothetical protein
MVEVNELRAVLYEEESKKRWKEIHKKQKAIREKKEKRKEYLISVGRPHLITKNRLIPWPTVSEVMAMRQNEGFTDKGLTESQIRYLFFYQKSRAVIHYFIGVMAFFALLLYSTL